MEEYEAYVLFGVIGLILAIMGTIAMILSNQESVGWVLVGSGIAIIWVSFHRVYHKKQ